MFSDMPPPMPLYSSAERPPVDTDAADTGDSKAAEENSRKNIELPENPIIPKRKRLHKASEKGIVMAENPAGPSLEYVSSSYTILYLLYLYQIGRAHV